jgi:hypothetical protein
MVPSLTIGVELAMNFVPFRTLFLANFAEFTFRDCPKSLGRTRGATLGTAVKALFGPFRSPHNV